MFAEYSALFLPLGHFNIQHGQRMDNRHCKILARHVRRSCKKLVKTVVAIETEKSGEDRAHSSGGENNFSQELCKWQKMQTKPEEDGILIG